jgi:signal transduction histidine kinase
LNLLNSLRGRLALISALVIALILTLAGLGLSWMFHNYIERRVASELQGRVLDLVGAFTVDGTSGVTMSRPPSDPRYRSPYSGVYWFIRENEATVLRSRSLWDSDITTSGPMSVMTSGSGPSGADVYVMQRPVTLGEAQAERHFILGVAVDKTEIAELSKSFALELALGLALSGVILFAGAWAQTSYGLRPLQAIRKQLTRLHQGEHDRLDGPFPAEIEPLTNDLNALFTRQKDMIARARERSGTLAHGLKTPMTVLYGEARKLELSGQKDTSNFIREQLDLMQKQLDRELSRARAHGESAGLGLQADVSATAARLIELMRRMPRGALLEWTSFPVGVQAAMDADDLGEVLGNLLDNARQWASSKVWLSVQPEAHGIITISVADDGPGIAQDFKEKAVTRGESASRSSGLGLAIAAELLAPYGAVLAITRSSMAGACISFSVPGKISASA